MLLGSLYAGMAFANSPCAAVHALAYPIGNYNFILKSGAALLQPLEIQLDVNDI